MSGPERRPGNPAALVDIRAAGMAGLSAWTYAVLRSTAPDAFPLDIALWVQMFPWWGIPAGVLGAVAGSTLGWLLAAKDRLSVQQAVRPVFIGTVGVLLALPLRPFIFNDVAPVLLVAGGAIGGLAAGWRLIRLAPTSDAPRIVGLAGFGLAALLALSWPPPQGDEPHYLTVAHSIVEDWDLDVADDYEARVFAGYHPDALSPHAKPGLREGSRYSMHGAGYPLFLAPAYAIGISISPRAAVLLPRLQQAALYGLFAWILVTLVVRLLGDGSAYRGGLAAVLLAPLLFAPLHLFPETPAMTLSAGAVLLLLGQPSVRRSVAAGACLAVLPWLGVKYIPLMLTAALAGLLLGKAARREAVALGLPIALSCIGHGAFTATLYGSLSPSAVYLGADPNFGRQPGYGGDWLAYLADWRGAVSTFVGYFLDQKEGLLAVAPHAVLLAAGGWLVWRRDWRAGAALTLVAAAHLGPYALSQQLGGQSPPARPLMAISWVWAIFLAAALSVPARAAVAALRGGLVLASAGITAFLLWDPTMLPHDYGVRGSSLVRALSPQGVEIWRWMPSWVNVSVRPLAVNAAWLGLVAVVGAFFVWDARRRDLLEDRTAPFQPAWAGATLAWAVLLAVALGATTVPVSDRARGVEVAPGIQAWTAQTRPENIWPEPGGLWLRPGGARHFVLATATEPDALEAMQRALIDTDAELSVGAWKVETSLEADAPLTLAFRPGPGHAWRGRRVYRAVGRAASGVSPAELAGGQDYRHLGLRVELRRVEDANR